MTQQGKSRAQNLRLGPELENVEQEVANYRRFVELCGELVQVNEQICRTRPVLEVTDELELARQKNFAAKVQQEVRQEIEQLVGVATDSNQPDTKTRTVPNHHPHRKRLCFYDPEGNDWEFVQYLSQDLAERHDYELSDN